MRYAVGYARYFKLPHNQIKTLLYASILHDIGKFAIPKKILQKKGSLTEKEYARIKKHPALGYYITKNIVFFKTESEIIRQHHERLDGKGYPYGLKANEINSLSRILSVCDAYDAMTSNRIYRNKIGHADAIVQLQLNAGTQFDYEIVENFCKYINEKIAARQLPTTMQGREEMHMKNNTSDLETIKNTMEDLRKQLDSLTCNTQWGNLPDDIINLSQDLDKVICDYYKYFSKK